MPQGVAYALCATVLLGAFGCSAEVAESDSPAVTKLSPCVIRSVGALEQLRTRKRQRCLVVLPKATLQGEQLQQLDLRQAYLAGANLEGANLSHANLEGANLEGANLTQAKLFGTKLKSANLKGADLRGSQLGIADFTNADLTNANLCCTKYGFNPNRVGVKHEGALWTSPLNESSYEQIGVGTFCRDVSHPDPRRGKCTYHQLFSDT